MNISVKVSELKQLSIDLLERVGVPVSQASIIADSIVFAHQTGKSTHGINRLPIYLKKIKLGFMTAETKLTPIIDQETISVYSAEHGFGQVAMYFGMEIAINKAIENGIGVVGIRNSNNFGTAAFFADLAAQKRMISMIFSNSAPAIAPWGGKEPIFGTNPIAWGFPGTEDHPPIILDMAVSKVARGKIRAAAKCREKIPFGLALDKNGKPTDDPFEAIYGSMIPIGEYKGYGLALVVDILAGLLTGGSFGGNVKPLSYDKGYSDYGHLIIILNPDYFINEHDYNEKMNQLISKIKKTDYEKNIFLPGEQSFICKKQAFEYVELSETLWSELCRLLQEEKNT